MLVRVPFAIGLAICAILLAVKARTAQNAWKGGVALVIAAAPAMLVGYL